MSEFVLDTIGMRGEPDVFDSHKKYNHQEVVAGCREWLSGLVNVGEALAFEDVELEDRLLEKVFNGVHKEFPEYVKEKSVSTEYKVSEVTKYKKRSLIAGILVNVGLGDYTRYLWAENSVISSSLDDLETVWSNSPNDTRLWIQIDGEPRAVIANAYIDAGGYVRSHCGHSGKSYKVIRKAQKMGIFQVMDLDLLGTGIGLLKQEPV